MFFGGWTFAVDQYHLSKDSPITESLIFEYEYISNRMQLSKTNKYLISALLLAVIFHGTAMFFTLEKTYDALIHLFFANHYANSWFEPWNYSWYTGFTTMGYPPLVHQLIGLCSFLGGLKFGLFTVALLAVVLFITGVYRFTLVLIPNQKVAGYAALLAVFSSSFVETLHLFGQLPSIIGIGVLMHALPEIYSWIKTGRYTALLKALLLIAITVCSHHVTPIFGMVFFIFPLIGLVIMDASREKVNTTKAITFILFFKTLIQHLKRIIVFGFGSLVLIIGCILPYWINTKNNPITQVPIPHGSRDHFLEVTSSGLVFFLIPYGMLLLLFPYFFYRFYSKRFLFFGLSLSMLVLLGTGGTTPIPRMLLGDNAFNILTLDRFTLWASIMMLPLFGEFCYRFVEGDFKETLQQKWGAIAHRLSGGLLVSIFIFFAVFTIALGRFRPSQPEAIKMQPIVNFLNQDDHDKWRYLPLGFGDQMAWLSTQTKATTVDGNYHSARRLPELTTRAVERLENSKFRGIEGIGSLQEFLTVPEKYNLKYVFSNDKFYDPILYFTGWHRLSRLENGIMVWEKAGINPLPVVIPKEDVPTYQKLLWGIIPMTTISLFILFMLYSLWRRSFTTHTIHNSIPFPAKIPSLRTQQFVYYSSLFWAAALLLLTIITVYQSYSKTTRQQPEQVIKAYYDALDFKNFEKAHTYLNPESGKDITQFMLEISVSDGLLSSYAKLDAIETTILAADSAFAKAEVHTTWITPLKAIHQTKIHELVQQDGNWYLQPEMIDPDTPPDQLFVQNTPQFYNHGKRRITSEQTYHEDVLKQPVVEVLSARLVYHNGQYSIVGEVQNVDHIPADLAITGTLYDKNHKELAQYNVRDAMKHKLLPQEVTPFRMDFTPIAWKTETDTTSIPHRFSVAVQANVATTDILPSITLSTVTLEDDILSGSLFNQSVRSATIPQLLVSSYNDRQELLWVQPHYLDESVRPQRQLAFNAQAMMDTLPVVHLAQAAYTSVNGLPNASIAQKVVPNRNTQLQATQLIPTTQGYVGLKLNAYIGQE